MPKKKALDIVSGRDVAIFLFANQKDDLIGVKDEMGKALVIPGVEISARTDEKIIKVHISQVKQESQENIVRASQTIAHEISRHFNLGIEHIPCILLLSKDEDEPLIIRTRGQADVRLFYKFIRSLRKLTESLPNVTKLEWARENIERLGRAKQDLLDAQEFAKKVNQSMQDTLIECYELLKGTAFLLR